MAGRVWGRKDWLLTVLFGLLVQAIWAWSLPEPGYMDAYYYTTNGRQLAAGQGFNELVIWQFLDGAAGFPTPSHTYWMPLTSILAAAGYLLDDGFRAAQLPFWLLSALLPLLTVAIGRQMGLARTQLWTAVGFTLAGGFYARFLNQPATFAPFAWVGAGALLFFARGRQGKWKPWLAAGLLAGLAHLTRADGLLLLLVGGWIWFLDLLRDRRAEGRRLARFQAPLAMLGGYFLVMGGWFWRNWRLFGRPLLTTGTQTIFLTNYDDLFAYGRSFSWVDLRAWGWAAILRLRGEGLLFGLQNLLIVNGAIILTPFVLWAVVKWWRDEERRRNLQPLFWYAVGLYGSMSLVFTLPGMRGGLFHSSIVLWPWTAVLAAAGIAMVVQAIASRLAHWQPARSIPIFSAFFVGVIFLLGLGLAFSRGAGPSEAESYATVGSALPPTAIVMVGNAPGFHYHTGLRALSVPNEPLPVLREAAEAFGATHLLLDKDTPQPLRSLYDNEVAPQGLLRLESPETYRLYQILPADE